MTGIGKAIQVNELFDFGLINYAMNHVGADKTSSASDKELHFCLESVIRLLVLGPDT